MTYIDKITSTSVLKEAWKTLKNTNPHNFNNPDTESAQFRYIPHKTNTQVRNKYKPTRNCPFYFTVLSLSDVPITVVE